MNINVKLEKKGWSRLLRMQTRLNVSSKEIATAAFSTFFFLFEQACENKSEFYIFENGEYVHVDIPILRRLYGRHLKLVKSE